MNNQEKNVVLVTNKDITFWTEHFGNKENPAIVLIHGSGMSSLFWPKNFCQKLADAGYFVINWDMRDAGLSTHLTQTTDPHNAPYSMYDIKDDVLTILDTYTIEKAHFLGHSLGGYIVQCLAALAPTRTLTGTSLCGGPFVSHEEFDTLGIKKIGLKEAGEIFASRLTEQPKTPIDGWLSSFKILQGTCPFDEQMAQETVEKIYARNPKGIEQNFNHVATFMTPEFGADLSTINCPFLIVQGKEDLIQPDYYGTALEKLIPNSELIMIPEYGHVFFNQKQWDNISDIFVQFLKKN